MAMEIPNIEFEHRNAAGSGIEILTLKNLKNRKQDLDHDSEKAHQLKFNMLAFYTQGKSKQLVDFVWHEIQENTLIHVSKGQINAFQFTEDLEGFLILFTDEFLKEQLNRLPNNEILRLFNSHLFSPKIQVPGNSSVRNYVELLYEEFISNTSLHLRANITESLFAIIFAKLEELKQFQTFHIKLSDRLLLFMKFKNLVSLNYSVSRNADFYATKLNVTYKHLNLVCKEIVDTTAKNFIDNFIILEAKRKLINSSIRSSELAFQLGFQEPTNFIKYFKKNTGFTPNKFKNKYN